MVEALNRCIEKNASEMVEALSGIVKIPSLYADPQPGAPYGLESRKALQYAMDLGKKLGFFGYSVASPKVLKRRMGGVVRPSTSRKRSD